MSIAVGHAAAVGKGLKSAAESFAKLTGSVNTRLLPRARRLAAYGLQPDKPLPPNLAGYTVMSTESGELIEGDATELADESPVPRLVAE